MREKTGARSIKNVFADAGRGILYCFRSQRNMKIHGIASALVLFAGVLCNVSRLEWCVLLLAIGVVLALEMLNTATETVVDLITPQYHPLAAIAKDVAAGAVLMGALTALGIAVFIFGYRLLRFW